MSALLEIDHVSKRFGDTVILDDISLEVSEGETLCIIGPSGAGKSSLLRCVNMLEEYQAGQIVLDGELLCYEAAPRKVSHGQPVHLKLNKRALARQRARIGMVFQQFNLFSHLTAIENICAAPINVLGVPRREAIAEARHLLDRVGLADRGDHYPGELSGGQQQRVAIARALAMHPKLMLFDEPTSALDPELVSEVLAVMKALSEEGQTMIVVTHEMGFARNVADRLIFMADAKVQEVGPAREVLDNPQSARLQDFLARVM